MYRKRTQSWLKHIDFLLIDLLCLHISYVLSFFVVFGISNPYGVNIYRNLIIVASSVDIIVIVFLEIFKDVIKRGGYKELTATIKQVVMVGLICILYLFITDNKYTYNSLFLIISIGVYGVLTFIYRLLWKSLLLRKTESVGRRSLLIVSTVETLDIVISNIVEKNYRHHKIAGIAVIDQDLTGQCINGVNIVANNDTLLEYVCKSWVDEVFIDIGIGNPYSLELTKKLSEMGVVTHNRIFESDSYSKTQQFINKLGDYAVLTSTMNCATPLQLFIKRAMDIFVGFFGCLFTGLLYIILAPIIKKQSPGPTFFAQERVGENGKVFKIYKFRSMYMDAEERKKELMEQNNIEGGLMFKMDDDPRIIGYKKLPNGKTKKGIGHFIRDYSIDEFPQFLNVLKGDMSLVGTRPPTVQEWENYELHHRARLSAKPGITGMWQVSGRSNITDFEEVVKLDKKYIRNWTISLDIKILLKTVKVVFKKEGSM